MKKLWFGFFLIISVLMVTSCGEPSTPGAKLKFYVEALVAGDYDTYLDGIATLDGNVEQKDEIKQLLDVKMKPELEKKGGVVAVKVVSEKISEDGQSAVVKIKIVYNKAKADVKYYQMILKEDVWKLKSM